MTLLRYLSLLLTTQSVNQSDLGALRMSSENGLSPQDDPFNIETAVLDQFNESDVMPDAVPLVVNPVEHFPGEENPAEHFPVEGVQAKNMPSIKSSDTKTSRQTNDPRAVITEKIQELMPHPSLGQSSLVTALANKAMLALRHPQPVSQTTEPRSFWKSIINNSNGQRYPTPVSAADKTQQNVYEAISSVLVPMSGIESARIAFADLGVRVYTIEGEPTGFVDAMAAAASIEKQTWHPDTNTSGNIIARADTIVPIERLVDGRTEQQTNSFWSLFLLENPEKQSCTLLSFTPHDIQAPGHSPRMRAAVLGVSIQPMFTHIVLRELEGINNPKRAIPSDTGTTHFYGVTRINLPDTIKAITDPLSVGRQSINNATEAYTPPPPPPPPAPNTFVEHIQNFTIALEP